MKTLLKSAMFASMLLASVSQPALAQKGAAAPAVSGTLVPGIAVASLEAIVENADANRTAKQQRPVTYKAQIDAYEAKRKQVEAQLQPMLEKFNKDRTANANPASLQQQAAAIQQIQESAQRDMNAIIQPVAFSEAYVTEQIEDKLDQAVKSAMGKNKVTLLLNPQAIVALNGNAYNLNQAILTELNLLLPAAQLIPPQGWEPRQIREARAQQGQPGQPAAPARPQPDGR